MNAIKYLIIPFIIFFSFPTQSSAKINCHAKHTLIHESITVTAFYHFILNKTNGVISIHGKIINNDVESIISRNIYFDYHNISKDDYILTSQKIAKIPADNVPINIMETHYPIFFTKEQKSLKLNIKRDPSGIYYITFVRTPLFFCIPR